MYFRKLWFSLFVESLQRTEWKGVLEFSGFLDSQKKYNHDIELTAFLCNENIHTGIQYFG